MKICKSRRTDYGSIWEPAYRDLQRGWRIMNGSEHLFPEFSGIRADLMNATDITGYYLQVNTPEALNRLETALGPHGRTYMRAWYLKKTANEQP